jgi:hypothetical protein
MRDQVLEIINNHPKHYSLLIKRNTALHNWVKDNSQIDCDHFPTMIYSAVYGVNPICNNNKLKKLTRWSSGLVNCGAANVCACTKADISKNVSTTKQNYSERRKTEIEDKRKSTMLLNYGVEYNSQRESVKTILKTSKLKEHQFNTLIDRDWLQREYVDNKRTAVDIAKELDCHDSAVRRYVALHGFEVRNYSLRSSQESMICRWLDQHNINYEFCNRTVLNGSEIDIYIPTHNLGIEVNGLLYHSYNPNSFHILRQKTQKEERTRHLNKTLLASEKQIQLLHFNDHQIKNKWDIVTNILSSKLKLQNKIWARECEIIEVNSAEQREFFNRVHIQGWVAAKKAYGLYYNDKLVQCISVGNNRYRSNELEILRFASEMNTTVVGGLSRLLKHIQSIFSNITITTYCDRDISNGNGYISAGFKIIEYTKPGYFWTDGTEIISRYKTQKTQLSKWLPQYNPNESESVNMFRAGYLRYWNTGNVVLRYEK